MQARLEHANITVSDARATAKVLEDVFGWHIRWEGAAMNAGYTIHIGDESSYLALYAPAIDLNAPAPRYVTAGSLAHIGIVVDDIDATEARVKEAGFTPVNHADYEPGKRFYFLGPDQVEYEVVSYS